MTLPTLASTDDLERRLGQPIDNPDQAEALLEYASSLIRAHTGKLYVDTEGDLEDVPDGVTEVCVEMVFRAVTNPTGATQDTSGPFSVSFGPEAAQRIYLSKSDRAILGGKGSAFTIDTTPHASTWHPLYGAMVNGPYGWAPGES